MEILIGLQILFDVVIILILVFKRRPQVMRLNPKAFYDMWRAYYVPQIRVAVQKELETLREPPPIESAKPMSMEEYEVIREFGKKRTPGNNMTASRYALTVQGVKKIE